MQPQKKMSDIKTKTARTTVRTVVSDTNNIPEKSPVKISRNSELEIKSQPIKRQVLKEKYIPTPEDITPSRRVSFKTIIRFIKRVIFWGFIGCVLFVISAFLYHGAIVFSVKKQSGQVADTFTAVQKTAFTGQGKTLPYYTYISNIPFTESDSIFSPNIFESIRIKLPSDAITDSSFFFATRAEQNQEMVVGVVFFKKQDVESYIKNNLLDNTYHNELSVLKNVYISPVDTSGNFHPNTQASFAVSVKADYIAEGSMPEHEKLSNQVVSTDVHTCKELLQTIPEITVDKCKIIPFWYKKMPKNPKFITIKAK